ncbi:hypothetical protein PWT90_10418 [Aphanocladium album]|nr:hypothetical protein PWT90_10418 [Aphanocladium album]
MQSSLICAACRRAALAGTPRIIIARSLSTTTMTASMRRALPPRATAALPLRTVSLRSYSSASTSASASASASAAVTEAETPSMSDAEAAIAQLLIDKLSPSEILVQDVSGGCGSMYAIEMAAEAFRGQTILKQQRMVNAALGDVVKSWHGVQIRTKVPGS